jgi:hypothetical protein
MNDFLNKSTEALSQMYDKGCAHVRAHPKLTLFVAIIIAGFGILGMFVFPQNASDVAVAVLALMWTVVLMQNATPFKRSIAVLSAFIPILLWVKASPAAAIVVTFALGYLIHRYKALD